ncbi:MAG: DNA cytosine methyltransferase [Acetatifactor sp.]|nr:DNA cytosine methyltransferase [Acetatifactor sp.]
MKVLSLFSGDGGLYLGMIQAGYTVGWANQIDENIYLIHI